MKRLWLTLALAMTALVACQQTPTPAPNSASSGTPGGYHLLGSVELEFGGPEATTARFTPVSALRPQGGLVRDANLGFTASGFSVVSQTNPTQARFLNARFTVRNKSGAALQNLTLVAYQKSGNTADTALKNISNFVGGSLNLSTYAQSIKPCHGMQASVPPSVQSTSADLTLLTESETATLQAAASSALASGEYLFPYGFVAQDISSGSTARSIPANTGADTGEVTLCMRTDGSNEPSGAAYRFSLTALVFENPTEATRISESLEELASSGAVSRANAISATEIAALQNSSLLSATNTSRINVCQVRTAGSDPQSPLARLETSTLTTAAGSLDACYGAGGKRYNMSFGVSYFPDPGVAVDSQGRFIVVGYTSNGGNDLKIARYNPDSSLDTSFGGTGNVVVDTGSSDEIAKAVTVDSSDRIIVAGYSGGDMFVARLNVNGGLDTGFGVGGIRSIDVNGLDDALSVVVSASGIAVVGSASSGANFAVAKLTLSGALDTSFNLTGKTTVDFGSSSEVARAVAFDSAGRIVVAGGSGNNFAVARFTLAGLPDPGFGTVGQELIDFGGTDVARAIAITSSDEVILAGGGGASSDFAVAKLTSAGVLDTSFGTAGTTLINFGSDSARTVAIDASGRIIVAGSNDTFNFAVARLTATGVLDNNFGTGGKNDAIDFGGLADQVYTTSFDANGRLVLAGVSSFANFSVAHVNNP